MPMNEQEVILLSTTNFTEGGATVSAKVYHPGIYQYKKRLDA